MKHSIVSLKNSVLLVSLTLLSSCSLVPQSSRPDIKTNEQIEWYDIWHNDANKNDLPRVLFIGDSITRGYFYKTAKHLKGEAYCSYLCSSACLGNPHLTQQIKFMLSQYDYSLIHFNNGLHGSTYSAEQYRKGFEETIKLLKKESNAPIIWAMITPHQYNKGAKLIDQRNAIAKEIVKRYDIPINDLHTLMMGKDDCYKDQDNTHFNAEGVELQAQQNADMILKYLNTL